MVNIIQAFTAEINHSQMNECTAALHLIQTFYYRQSITIKKVILNP